MRVLLIGDHPPPPGGVATHVAELKRFLVERGVEARVLDIGRGGRPAPDVVPARAPRQFGLRLAQFSAGGWLLHLHTSGNNRAAWLVALATASAARTFGVPAVLTVHSGLAPGYLARSRLGRAVARAALRGMTATIAVSAPIARALEGAGRLRAPVPVVPAFLSSQVQVGQPPPGFDAARSRWPVLVAMAGHPSPVYGLELMLAALGDPEVKARGIGLALFGPETEGAAATAAAQAAGVSDRVAAFGELPHDQALALVKASNLFVRPTSADGDSISVREALALGVPVVASDAAARPPGTRLFRAGDSRALATALLAAVGATPPAVPAPDAGRALMALYESLTEEGRGAYVARG